MADYTVKRFDEMDPIFGGFLLRARAAVGVTSFGMQVINLPPNSGDGYPNHDHAESGQEEVYVVLKGAADFDIEGASVRLEPEMALRVGAATRRKISTGDEGAQILALGGTPGQAYDIPAFTEEGGPTPRPRSD
jgi:mannose-6-phosphate isomerase-like protein (cupin superfamily)